MQHVMKQALLGSVAITRKGEEDDPVSIVTKSLEDLQKNIDERLKKVEGGAEIKALIDRLDELEKKGNRPGAKKDSDDQAEIERKALASFMRTGDDVELKAAATDNNVDGGYFVLPTVDLSIRTLMTDLSPMRQLAEVVSISTDKYERFYSLGKRGAQWVTEREDRPQDTARPELKKSSYGVAELYAAPAATRQLIDDAAVDIASWLVNNATHDFSETEGEAFMTGDGQDNSPKGLLTYQTAPEKDFTRAWGSFQYVPSGALSSGTLTTAQWTLALVKLIGALRRPYKGNAVFLMNTNTATVLRALVDDNGRALWAPTGNLIEGIEHPLLGYRVEIDESMPDIGANAMPIAFGDFRQGYVIVDRQGVRVNVDELTQKGKIIFDVYKRVGGGAGDFNAIKFLKNSAN
ncbi:phage major capsid protein [Neorhizobium sp. Rsf11]|uniref:Phage major capsid protein n=1 Tax=Neorhizobium phenanthreniclasticum TaxID=3157917 RepID=A0ABV0M3U9_9HYPH